MDIDSIYIPNRDIQSYDDLIPAVALYMVTLYPMYSTGGLLWN